VYDVVGVSSKFQVQVARRAGVRQGVARIPPGDKNGF